MNIYIVELYGGYCGLRGGSNLRTVRKEAIEDEGKNNVQAVRLATKEEIDHCRAMDGYVPGKNE